MALISTCWLDRAAQGLITEANNRTGKVGSQWQAALQLTTSPRSPRDTNRTLMGTFTRGRRLPRNLLVPSHATVSIPCFLTGLQLTPHLHRTGDLGPACKHPGHGQGFAPHLLAVWLSWSHWSGRSHYKLSTPTLCPKAERHVLRSFPKDASNLDRQTSDDGDAKHPLLPRKPFPVCPTP